MYKAYVIECRTGCTCCSEDNHYRGPYKTREDAERRIAFFKNPDNKYCPVASQYARRGSYFVEKIAIEHISSDRRIINSSIVVFAEYLDIINVNNNGSIDPKYGCADDEFKVEIFDSMKCYG